MTYTQKVVTEKVIKPSGIYKESAKESIKIILQEWEIIDFTLPTAGERYIAYSGNFTLIMTRLGETGGQPRFIVRKKTPLPVPDFPEWE